MRSLLTIVFFLLSTVSFCQADSLSLKDAVTRLDKALLGKDTMTLKTLLHADVTFGHSSGWVETKKEVISDLATGFLVYKSLANDKISLVLNKNWASVRMATKATGARDGKDFDISLHVLQVWMKTKNGWKLVARQSAKLS
jgi:Domain of unknown function (DUF4440)